jgi:uncharacterized protein (TIGR02453 family)
VTFEGFPIAALDFYEDLENDNSKAFWAANKTVYDEQVKAPIVELVTAVAAEFGDAKLFRPYRDIRFAKDKTPYKTHQGVWFNDSRRYLQVSAAGLFVGGGYWHTTSEQVARLRRAIADDRTGPDLAKAIAAVTKAGFDVHGEQLIRVPTGFDKEHPRADLLRYKALTCHREFGAPDWLATKRAQTEIVKAWRAMSPLVGWLDQHVGMD